MPLVSFSIILLCYRKLNTKFFLLKIFSSEVVAVVQDCLMRKMD